MNTITHTTHRTRSIARFAAGIGVSLAVLATTSPAFAETPPAPGPDVEIGDAPECVAFDLASMDYYFGFGDSTAHLFVGYNDGVETCDVQVDIKRFLLAGPDAAWNDPGSSLEFYGGYPIEVIEDETEQSGVHQWIEFSTKECSEVHLFIDDQLVQVDRFDTADCGDLPFTDGDGGSPEPDRPGDLTNGDPGEPGDNPGDNPGDGGLPQTGSTSGLLVALAAGLTALGGAAMGASRRRVTA